MSIQAFQVNKEIGETRTQVVKNVSLEIQEGEFIALLGKSGSGKSTLLYLLSSLDNPTSGDILIDGQNLKKISDEELHDLRNRKIGFVFQFHYLLPELTALENILMPTFLMKSAKDSLNSAKDLLKKFGLEDKGFRLPRQLSGGEQQRVAIARSLIMKPQYLFADEPTGSLDTANGELVMNILKTINETYGTTIVLVTHDLDFAKFAKRQIHLSDGRVV